MLLKKWLTRRREASTVRASLSPCFRFSRHVSANLEEPCLSCHAPKLCKSKRIALVAYGSRNFRIRVVAAASAAVRLEREEKQAETAAAIAEPVAATADTSMIHGMAV